jgi:transcriptional antiterminator RfaH
MNKVWRAVYTKPRSEKKVAERLSKNTITVYCPVQTTLKQWSDRKKKVLTPIFPSYIFVQVAENEMLSVLKDPGVINFVFWQGKPAIIKNEEINLIKEHLNHTSISTEVVGDEIIITQGILSGVKGKIKEITTNNVILVIESIGLTITIKKNTANV